VDPEFASSVVTQDLRPALDRLCLSWSNSASALAPWLRHLPGAVCTSYNIARVSLSGHADLLRVLVQLPSSFAGAVLTLSHFKYNTYHPNYSVSLLYVVACIAANPYM
jgi:hypothetical protein